jgi:hypothetical protein
METYVDISTQYLDFASFAHDESPCFEEWALGVARDDELTALLEELPAIKQQPNLVFAAARWHGVPAPAPYDVFRRELLADWDTIRTTVLSRSTQTNEVGRLATLVPAFAQLQTESRQPLALLEVGASAGLCLYPDRYDYCWSTDDGPRSTAAGAGVGARPVLRCDVTGAPPLPGRPPQVAWRGGLDLNPLDVADDDAMAWLENLVWPEQHDRRTRLRQAIEVARAEPPLLLRGDLFTALPELLRDVPDGTTVVVFHSAVVAYLDQSERLRFQEMMTGLVARGVCHWVSNEGKRVLPDVTATGPVVPEELATLVLGIDGRAVAWTHGHGASMTWFDSPPGEQPGQG